MPAIIAALLLVIGLAVPVWAADKASSLHAAVAAVCPIAGVKGPFPAGSAGLPWPAFPDKSGALWAIDFAPGATQAQQGAAIAALATYADPRAATGKQIAEALTDLGQMAAFDAAVQASKKPEDRMYWYSGYHELIPESSAKLARIAAAAGVNLAVLFDKAVTEPAN